MGDLSPPAPLGGYTPYQVQVLVTNTPVMLFNHISRWNEKLLTHRALNGTRSMQLDSTWFVLGRFGIAKRNDWSVLLPCSQHHAVCAKLNVP